MKKLILLLFLSTFCYGQAEFEKIAITENVQQDGATRIIVQDASTKELNWVLKSSIVPESYSKIVYVNATNPNSATIFDLNNPPVTNDDLLKGDVNNLYVGTDASTWVYNTPTLNYITKAPSGSSIFNYAGTPTPANNTTSAITRTGSVTAGSFIKLPASVNTAYSSLVNNGVVLGARNSGMAPSILAKTASLTNTGMFHASVQAADVARTGEDDFLFRTGFYDGTETLANLTTAGSAYGFYNAGFTLMNIFRNGNVVISPPMTGVSTDLGYRLYVGGALGILGNITQTAVPTTSTIGSFDLITRNTTTGFYEKVLNSGFLHTSGIETFTGVKFSTNTGATSINGLSLANNGGVSTQVFNISNTDAGIGTRISNSGSGNGEFKRNTSTATGALSVSDSQTGSTADLYQFTKNNVLTAWFNHNGNLTVPSVNISGQTASTVAIFDASKNIVSASTVTYPNLTELANLKGITGPINTTYAPLASPTFTGDPKAPTATAGDNDTSIATTAFVTGALTGKKSFIYNFDNIELTNTASTYFMKPLTGLVYSDNKATSDYTVLKTLAWNKVSFITPYKCRLKKASFGTNGGVYLYVGGLLSAVKSDIYNGYNGGTGVFIDNVNIVVEADTLIYLAFRTTSTGQSIMEGTLYFEEF